MELITDRTEADVLLGNEKGQYGYQDLNRVEQAVQTLCTLAARLDIHPELTTKTDWGLPGLFSADSWPAQSQMDRYLQNVHTLCHMLSVAAPLPETMVHLTWQGANAIENALQEVYLRVQGVLHTYRYSGDVFAGEENCL